MPFENCPEFLKPRLRLFLSADIVGSTALKQSPFGTHTKTEQRASWFSKIQGFYFEAHKAFLSECGELCSNLEPHENFGPLPFLWKTIGDEVLFVKQLTDHRQLALALRCWMRAVNSMRSFVKKDSPRLDVKCTAWIAGFPFRNSEVAVAESGKLTVEGDGDWFLEGGRILNRMYRGESVDARIDYIGPSIDIGFRLAEFSTSRRFIISVDIAHILAIANPGREVRDPVFDVYYDGAHALKGVLGGVNYPIFWIDLSPEQSIDRYEDNLTSISPVNRDRLREYCNKFYAEHSMYMFPPFIVSDSEQQIVERPSWYDRDHAALVKNFEVESAADEVIETSVMAEEVTDTSELDPAELIAQIDELLNRFSPKKDDDLTQGS